MSASNQVSWHLVVKKGSEVIQNLTLEKDLIVGRSDQCSLRLEDRAVSRLHLIIKKSGDNLSVERKSDFAPLIVNGRQQSQSTLQSGDQIQVGPFLIQVERKESPSSSPATADVSAQTEKKSSPEGEAVDQGAPAETHSEGVNSEGSEQVQGASSDHSSSGAGNSGENIEFKDSNVLEGGAGASTGDSQFPVSSENLSAYGDSSSSESIGEADSSLQGDSNASSSSQLSQSKDSSEGSEASGEEDGKTRAISLEKVVAKLFLRAGSANVTEYTLQKDEVFIGRGKDCDITLDDKKASRKNSIIRRAGLQFSIKDLDSSNGTYINGEKITERELNSDDLIQIGNAEFEFKVMSLEYESQQGGFIAVPEEAESEPAHLTDPMMGSVTAGDGVALSGGGTPSAPGMQGQGAGATASGDIGSHGIPGITGIGGVGAKNRTLIERFRALPKRTQMIGAVAAALFFFWLLDDDQSAQQPKAKAKKKEDKPVASASRSPTPMPSGSSQAEGSDIGFDQLGPDKKKYVESQHDLAFDYYKNKEYDKALFEIEKVFSIVSDYKDSREIERYAREGKRKLEAIEEENRKRQEALALKNKLADHIEKIKKLMEQKAYAKAKELYAEVLAVDPDNAQIAAWSKEIEQYEDQQRVKQQQLDAQRDINQQGVKQYQLALGLEKKKKFYEALQQIKIVLKMGITNKKLQKDTQIKIEVLKNEIKALRDPILKDALAAETANDYEKAFSLYQQSTRLDPQFPSGYAGMNRIRGFLHEKAKQAYIEGVFAEGYSDFEAAEKSYKDCLKIAPAEDIYHDRAKRKLARFIKTMDGGSNQAKADDESE